MAQPALSRQVRRLEAELDVRLLSRTKRDVRLTDAGRVFSAEARQILAQADHAVRITRLTGRGESGELVVGCTQAGEVGILPRVLPVFQRRCPRVNVAVESLGTAAQLEAIRLRRIHVGFVRLPCDDHGLLAVEVVLREPLIVALPRAHRLAVRRRIPLAALAGEPYIGFPRGLAPGFYDSVIALCRRTGFSLNVVTEADHFQTQLSLIALGFGLSLVPASTRALARRGVVYRPLDPPLRCVDTGVCYRRDSASEVVRAFLGVVRDVLPSPATRRFPPPALTAGAIVRTDGGRG